MKFPFKCIDECSECCIEREYFPSIKFGKIGVLTLPEEKEKIISLAKKLGITIKILPRIGVSNKKSEIPKVLAYQLMGIQKNGNTCPFLDTESKKRSPHGGFVCKIYDDRPLACRAYPLIESNPHALDPKCKFCQHHGNTDKNLNSELESLVKIKSKMSNTLSFVWRYATGIGETRDRKKISKGWIKDD